MGAGNGIPGGFWGVILEKMEAPGGTSGSSQFPDRKVELGGGWGLLAGNEGWDEDEVQGTGDGKRMKLRETRNGIRMEFRE